MVKELVEGRFDGPTREQHVVDQNDRRSIYVDRYVSWRELLRNRVLADIVAVKRDVECADAAVGEESSEALGQDDAPVGDAQKDEPPFLRMPRPNAFDDPLNGGVDFVCIYAASVRHEDALCRVSAGMGSFFPSLSAALLHKKSDGRSRRVFDDELQVFRKLVGGFRWK